MFHRSRVGVAEAINVQSFWNAMMRVGREKGIEVFVDCGASAPRGPRRLCGLGKGNEERRPAPATEQIHCAYTYIYIYLHTYIHTYMYILSKDGRGWWYVKNIGGGE